jgi:hypothetical protein
MKKNKKRNYDGFFKVLKHVVAHHKQSTLNFREILKEYGLPAGYSKHVEKVLLKEGIINQYLYSLGVDLENYVETVNNIYDSYNSEERKKSKALKPVLKPITIPKPNDFRFAILNGIIYQVRITSVFFKDDTSKVLLVNYHIKSGDKDEIIKNWHIGEIFMNEKDAKEYLMKNITVRMY